MKYYVTADTHGYFSVLRRALELAGYFTDNAPHKLVILGDLFDRGSEAKEMQEFVLEQMAKDSIILIKGNHEDLFQELVGKDLGLPYSHHVHNGTYDTALQLTGFDGGSAQTQNYLFASAARKTPYYTDIIPSMLDFFETEHFIFTHGWIPCFPEKNGYSYIESWRDADEQMWKSARWLNGMDAVQTCMADKVVVCGHWHASYGHSKFEKLGSEFGMDADFTPYMAKGIVALDACTAVSHEVNVITLED